MRAERYLPQVVIGLSLILSLMAALVRVALVILLMFESSGRLILCQDFRK
jgi:hypothetical protein